ncbi:abhydrolase domain-containing protein 9 [Microsporum canis CBS 113480]|uniref:Abhydrolase domain-containing protein 9 n=1 Tax=Arthroderma otae (strain ATCC MYA-4605 / CBS 113480) TaxID=554155 RepID=C5FDY6_ARTOC|nr:abhydrolase domain-containing protein 9 [Microsporum canis CBS 113480]EEQ28020.1 abhydrolase domain-containing protein 9 [Microsporum canis CBS 113480]
MVSPALKMAVAILSFAYGIFTLVFYGIVAIFSGVPFRQTSEKERLEFQLASDRFWNLSKNWKTFSHRFMTLKNGFKVHYLANVSSDEIAASDHGNKPLVIFLHGFPDSWAMWRHILSSRSVGDESIMIALDLPGYGGTDSLDVYGPTEILETLTEFIVTLRDQYKVDDGNRQQKKRVIVVAHDWGAILAFRLAAEAPQLADRFIITNGILPDLMKDNVNLSIESANKMFKTFLKEPWRSRHVLCKAIKALAPVLRQLKRSHYVFVFHLPIPLVRYVGHGGNYSLLKAIHEVAAGKTGGLTIRDAQEAMASTLGPSIEELETMTADGETYSKSVRMRAEQGNFVDTTSYYRHGAAADPWHKSLETISALHSICPDERRRTSCGTGVFDPAPGALKANATIIWGMKDDAIVNHLALEGIPERLVQGSQVIALSQSGHFTPMEVESRGALEEAVLWAVKGETGDVGQAVLSVYPEARVIARQFLAAR